MEDDIEKEFNFNAETLTFTLQLMKKYFQTFPIFEMSFPIFKTTSYCVGGRNRSVSTNIYGDVTSKSSKVLIGPCSFYNRKNSRTVSDNTLETEGLGGFLKFLGKRRFIAPKRMAKNVLKTRKSSGDRC